MRLRDTVNTIEKEITDLRLRIEFLECEHEYALDRVLRYMGMYEPHRYVHALKCSKCGHILKYLSEKEYLLAKFVEERRENA